MSDSKDPFGKLPVPRATEPSPLPARPTGLAELRSVRLPPLPAPPQRTPRILVIDDEVQFLESLSALHRGTALAQHAELICEPFEDGDYPALLGRIHSHLARQPLDAMVLDLNLIRSGETSGGLQLLRRLRQDLPQLEFLPCAILTGQVDPEFQRLATEEKVDQFIIKLDPGTTGQTVVALLPYRLVTELPRWQAAAEERFWHDLSRRVSAALAGQQAIPAICQDIGERLHRHFGEAAVYVHEFTKPHSSSRMLVLRGGNDGLGVGPAPIPLPTLPVLERFLCSNALFACLGPLTAEDLGRHYAPYAQGRYLLAARMAIGEELLGVITLYRPGSAAPFRTLDGMMAQLLAQQLGPAIYRERQIQVLQSRQAILPEVLSAFARADDEREIFSSLQQTLHSEVAERAAPGEVTTTIRALRPGTQSIPRQATPSGRGAEFPDQAITLDMMGSTVARAVLTGTHSLDNDVTPEKTEGFVFAVGGERSHITVPLRSDEICIGAACIECYEPDVFTENDIPFATMLCGAATEAIIRLRSQRFAIGMARLLGALTIDHGQLRSDVLGQAVRLLFDYTGFAELLYLVPPGMEPSALPWHVREVYGPEGVRYAGARLGRWQSWVTLNWDRTSIRASLIRGEAVDFTADPALIADDGDERGDRSKTLSQATLLIGGEHGRQPRAVIALLFLHPLSLSRHHRALLAEFSAVLARLLDQEQDFGSLLHELTLREQNARLGMAYHQLRHVLVNQIGGIRQVALALPDRPAGVKAKRALILDVVEDVARDIGRAANIAKVPEFAPAELAAIWGRVRGSLARVAAEKGSFIAEGAFDPASWPTDAAILESILYNLVDNALSHGGPGTRIGLRVHRLATGIALDVADTGRGIPVALRDRIFEPYKTTRGATAGLGLYMSKARARDLGGDLALLPSDGPGATFRVTLPERDEGAGYR